MQDFVYRHELYHILLRHHLVDNLVPNSSNMNHLISIQEREADIHAASKNIHAAIAGKNFACDRGNADIIDQKRHCREMKIMYALMKQKEKLS